MDLDLTFDMADVRPTVLSFLTVTIMAIVGINLLKWFVSKYPIPGLTEVVMNT